MSIADELRKIIRDEIEKGSVPIAVEEGRAARESRIRFHHVGPDGRPIILGVPALKEERCVLVVDLVGFSKRGMEEQLLLVETMNRLFYTAEISLRARHQSLQQRHGDSQHIWEIYKGTGDGAIFVFGNLIDPMSVRDALAFASWTMSRLIAHNTNLPPNALNHVRCRMALAYGKVFTTSDLAGNSDILGDAINVAARLAGSRTAIENAILIDESIYHNLMINHASYFLNEDDSPPQAGEFSDYLVGLLPNGNDFLYIEDDGYHDTKDRRLKAFNLSGRLAGIDVRRVVSVE